MFGRTLLFLAVLGAAFCLPVLLTHPQWAPTTRQPIDWMLGRGVSDGGPREHAARPTPQPGGDAWTGDAGWGQRSGDHDPRNFGTAPAPRTRTVAWPPIGGPPAQSLADVVRFDATPEWLMNNWARVARLPSRPDWQVYRLPLATGTQPHDVTGSLTYAFDRTPLVQRVTLVGRTGDPTWVIQTAVSIWNMAPDPSFGPNVYLGKVDGRVLGVLRVVPAGLVRADAPSDRYEVLLELNRATSSDGLSDELTRLIDQLKPPVDSGTEAAGESTSDSSSATSAGESSRSSRRASQESSVSALGA